MNIDVLISEEEINKRITELGKQISSEYEGEELVVVGVLNGPLLCLLQILLEKLT